MESCGTPLLTSCHVVWAARSVVPANKSFATMTAIRFGLNPPRTATLKVMVVPPLVFCRLGLTGPRGGREKISSMFLEKFRTQEIEILNFGEPISIEFAR